jgi:predicted alpha/beta hydrolase family esterase
MNAKIHRHHPEETVVILHGLDGSPEGHWQGWLAGELRRRGRSVLSPELPRKDRPNLIDWMDELHVILSSVGPGSVVVAHSLGALLWLYYASVPEAVKLSRVLLVAPPGGVDLDQSGRVIGQRALHLDRQLIQESADRILLVGSENDPLCIWGFISEYALPLGLPFLKLPDEARHVNVESGFGPWPFPLRWCLQSEESLFPRESGRERRLSSAELPVLARHD